MCDFMELLKFIAASPGHFFGTCILLSIVFAGIGGIIREIRKVRKQ